MVDVFQFLFIGVLGVIIILNERSTQKQIREIKDQIAHLPVTGEDNDDELLLESSK